MVTGVIQSVTLGDGLYRCTLWLKGRSIMYSCNHNILYCMMAYVFVCLFVATTACGCICMFIWLYIYIYGYWDGSRWASPECKMSMSLSPFGNLYICSYARIFTYTNTSKKDKSCDPCGPKFRAISTCIVYLSQQHMTHPQQWRFTVWTCIIVT